VRTTAALLGALSAGVVVALGTTIPLAHGDTKTATISVSEIKDGMKGYGLTVFRGTEPTKFDVEVIGILHHFRPGQELIVIKTPKDPFDPASREGDERLQKVNTVKGMSGSPIFFDGRVAGAYSYSLSSFETEPVAGVTPIDLMLTEMRRPIPPGFWPLEPHAAPLPAARPAQPSNPPPHGPHASNTTFDGAPGTYDLQEHARQLQARFGGLPDPSRTIRPVSTPLLMAGVGDRAAAGLRTLVEPLGLEPMQGGGGTAPDANAPQHFVNGGALGVELSRGDVSLMGLGTATYVDGAGKVAGFGHPMLEGGDEALPTCIGKVLWVDASGLASHKVGECARSIGTLVQDRQTAIILDEHITAPVVPIDVDITGVTGAPRTHWHAEVSDDKFMAPGLTAVVLGSVIEATTSERRDLTWKMTAKVAVSGHGTIDLEDVGVASGGAPETGEWFRSKIVNTVGDVMNNPWEHARIEKVEAKFDVTYARDLLRLRGVEVLDPIVDAGQKARVRLHLVHTTSDKPAGEPDESTRVVEVTMPAELAGKDVEIEILAGYDVTPELAPPENMEQLLANEPRQTVAPRSVVVQFRVPSQGIAFRGHVADRLPAFTLDSLRPQSSDEGPEAFPSWSRTVVPLEKFMEGRDKVKVKVRPVVR
jgi:hypothetical protein